MTDALRLRSMLALGVSAMALGLAAPGYAADAAAAAPKGNDDASVVQTLVVTAQRREEALQDVPLAVSAFSSDGLKKQQIQGGVDLLRAIPNVTSAKGQYGGFNFQIRGIGTKTVGTAADGGVAVHENDIPLTENSLGDADFFDVSRVEVSRGPQGTLFGKNATGGVVNIITNKPTDRYQAEITAEYGNYDSKRVKGYVNIPFGDTFAVRAAATYLKRDGFNTNDYLHTNEDGRDLWSGRLTAQWKPTDNFRTSLMWERFSENDDRVRTGKTLCTPSPAPSSVLGVPTSTLTSNLLSQGCANGSIYGSQNLGGTNSVGTLTGLYGSALGLGSSNLNAGIAQSPNLRHYDSWTSPKNNNKGDLFIWNAQWDLTNHLSLTNNASYSTTHVFTRSDFTHSIPTGVFNPINLPSYYPGVFAPITNGTVADPQVGTTNTLRTLDYYLQHSREVTEELRLSSSFSGPLNFSAGFNYVDFDTVSDYYVLSNGLDVPTEFLNLSGAGIPVDTRSPPNDSGTNYFDNRTTYRDRSYSAFGEVYYKFSDDLKFTVGLRGNDDRKFDIPQRTLLTETSTACITDKGCVPVTSIFHEITGRANVEWTPKLSFTDKTMIYASYSRGYKPGGANPGTAADSGVPKTFNPEFVDAFEVGTKNALFGGSMILNMTAFYYDYTGYQISAIVHQTSVNSNIDAKLYGLEIEGLWEPIRHLRFNGNIGYLHSEISNGSQPDPLNLPGGDPTLSTLKSLSDASTCVAKTQDIAAVQAYINAQPTIKALVGAGKLPSSAVLPKINALFSDPSYYLTCQGVAGLSANAAALNPLFKALGIPSLTGFSAGAGNTANYNTSGNAMNLKGNQLPNSPEFTVSAGVQYEWNLEGGWRLTPRADFYFQDKSYARIFNTAHDQLKAWDVTNLSLSVDNLDMGLNLQAYVKNVFDKTYIQDSYLQDASVGSYTTIFLGDPRTYGVSLTKKF